MLDEIVAELRALSGAGQFDFALVARANASPVGEPMLPLPSPKETVEQIVAAANASDTSAERLSLLSVAPPPGWCSGRRSQRSWRSTGSTSS
jgi:hypothetical protein